jgi:MerR HTH family regulatory protein
VTAPAVGPLRRRGSTTRAATMPDLSALGVSPRQLYYWVRCGYLRPENPAPGNGYRLVWPPEELEVARKMGALVDVGCTLPLAHEVARGRTVFPNGITITIDPPPETM